MKWPELSLAHAAEAREEGIEIVHREEPDTIMLALDSVAVYCFDLEDGRQSHDP